MEVLFYKHEVGLEQKGSLLQERDSFLSIPNLLIEKWYSTI